MGYLLTGLGFAFIFLMLLAFLFFDRVLKIYYAEFKDDWEKAGAPHGFFWVPKESQGKIKIKPNSASTRARTRHVFAWVFSMPGWMANDQAARTNLYKVRALFTLALAALVSFVVLYISR
jgi:hypothetical protein